jgi:hypothetical protein
MMTYTYRYHTSIRRMGVLRTYFWYEIGVAWRKILLSSLVLLSVPVLLFCLLFKVPFDDHHDIRTSKHTQMSSSLPTIAFLTTSLLIIVYERRKRRSGASAKARKSASSLTKEQVIQLREKHFMKAVSVSYANSGGLLIIGVGKST